ncbi:hypothetical protein FBU30_004935 [Linnemannia zychae]|nr:hypothetical protein FBU30_004935 [Linnemannia zychae]
MSKTCRRLFPETKLPPNEMRNPYIRTSYHEFYGIIDKQSTTLKERRAIASGTADIGISTFPVYIAIRCLIKGGEAEPRIIIFHIGQCAKSMTLENLALIDMAVSKILDLFFAYMTVGIL